MVNDPSGVPNSQDGDHSTTPVQQPADSNKTQSTAKAQSTSNKKKSGRKSAKSTPSSFSNNKAETSSAIRDPKAPMPPTPTARNKTVTSQATPLSSKVTLLGSVENQEQSHFFGQQSNVSLDQIGGLSKQIQTILDVIELPIVESDLATALRLSTTRTILIHGQRGTGKTMVMNALFNELKKKGKIQPFKLDSAFILQKREGETEANLLYTFREAAANSPSVVFIDDIDVLCESKKHSSDTEKRVTATLCCILDSLPDDDLSKRITVIASTSKLDATDTALRRPGRFDIELEFTVPLRNQRREILEKMLSSASHNLTSEQITLLADDAHSFTGADLMLVCRESALLALKVSVFFSKKYCIDRLDEHPI